jgi:multiple sugar transport system ATP-binding protein
MWTANVDPEAEVATGQPIALRLDLEAAYFFDARTGLAVPEMAVPHGRAA